MKNKSQYNHPPIKKHLVTSALMRTASGVCTLLSTCIVLIFAGCSEMKQTYKTSIIFFLSFAILGVVFYGCEESLICGCYIPPCPGMKLAVDNPSPTTRINVDTTIDLGYQDTLWHTLYYAEVRLVEMTSYEGDTTLNYQFNYENGGLSYRRKQTPQRSDTTTYSDDPNSPFSKYPYTIEDTGFYVVERLDSARTKIKLRENHTSKARKIKFWMSAGLCNGMVTFLQQAKP